jgi:hypothetical protein
MFGDAELSFQRTAGPRVLFFLVVSRPAAAELTVGPASICAIIQHLDQRFCADIGNDSKRHISMVEEIYPSSYLCDCGHESHFFENTVREAKAASKKMEIRLGDSHTNEHTIVFSRGEAVSIQCPERGVVIFQKHLRGRDPEARASDPLKKQTLGVRDKVIWLKRIPGGEYVYPVRATVLGATAKRIKIEADDEGGTVIRYVPIESLQRRE